MSVGVKKSSMLSSKSTFDGKLLPGIIPQRNFDMPYLS
jgi:hypothetical protein